MAVVSSGMGLSGSMRVSKDSRTSSKVKYGEPIGLDALGKVCGKINIPVFALGGIKSSRIKKVSETGAHGAAMISEILKAGKIRKKREEIINLLNQ